MANDDADRSLRARGITQRFGPRLVLDQVDLEVPAGQVIGLLGPNGAGKTTLMRIVFGVLPPDAGAVEWHGRPATAGDRRGWGYMPQERGLYRDMRVGDHLVWLARLHGLEAETARTRSSALLERLGLADRSRSAVKELSGGMGQRGAAGRRHGPRARAARARRAVRGAGSDGGRVPVGGRVGAGVRRSQPGAVEPPARPGRGHLRLDHLAPPRTRRAERRGGPAEGRQPHRYLRVDVAVDDDWLARAPATVEHREPTGTRLRLEPGADAGAVLDLVRSRAHVEDFGVVAPSLSELFLAATGASSEELDPALDGRGGGSGDDEPRGRDTVLGVRS
jgi:ABC-2 type transport system ATP-binding protein